ncbi:MAG: hypothetical protein HC808_03525 [Candidatus Competibacteraceae bacterium]|nr:hypothetical protein [Candidatus Competibacteraceae bacterium]
MNLSTSLVIPLMTIASAPAYGQVTDLSGWGFYPLINQPMLVNMATLIYQWNLERRAWRKAFDPHCVNTDPRRAWRYDSDDYAYGVNTYIPPGHALTYSCTNALPRR